MCMLLTLSELVRRLPLLPRRMLGRAYALHLQPYGEPSAPVVDSLTAKNAHQLEVAFTEPTDKGGDAIDRYVIEFSTNTSTGAWDANYMEISFQLANVAGNDSYGYWRLSFQDKYETALLPWGASALEVKTAINKASTQNVDVRRAVGSWDLTVTALVTTTPSL